MELSPLNETLIYLEDKKNTSLSELSFIDPATLRGILGKMEAMKLVEKFQDKIVISKSGQKYLNSILDSLHEKTLHWDEKWRLISFSVPESRRPLRDKFRRYLETMGVKMILTGLWITPLDITDKTITYAKELGIYKNVIITQSKNISTGITREELQKLWNFEKSKTEIYNFIEEAEIFLRKADKSAFEYKKMIFRYATILSNQPKLPIELFPNDWPQFRANLVYRKLKRQLTQKV